MARSMMTKQEWDEGIEWICKRWPQASLWTPDIWATYYEELRGFDASDMWSALSSTLNEGRDHPPNVSVLKTRAAEIARHGASPASMYAGRDRQPELPADTRERPEPPPAVMPQEGWLARWYPDDPAMTWERHIEIVHRKKGAAACTSKKYCPIHNDDPSRLSR